MSDKATRLVMAGNVITGAPGRQRPTTPARTGVPGDPPAPRRLRRDRLHDRIVDVALLLARVEGRRFWQVERRVAAESLREIGVGQKEHAVRHEVCLTGGNDGRA